MHLYCVCTQCAYAIALGRTGQMHEEIEREREREAWEFSIYEDTCICSSSVVYALYRIYQCTTHTCILSLIPQSLSLLC